MKREVKTLPYSLPDIDVLYNNRNLRYKIWHPDRTYIVLGRSNKAEIDLNLDLVLKDNITVLQRPSGGETVVLTPKTIIFSITINAGNSETPKSLFKRINQLLIEEFEKSGVVGIHSRGISDLSIGEKKIMGSSMYLKENLFFYHAVLNISEHADIIAAYLKHPKREPEYRKGRSHTDFITSLKEKGYNLSGKDCELIIGSAIEKFFINESVK